ncbi:MAG: M3 family oligoendopeptidase [Gemmatimonadaceae bacterium]
MLPVLPASPADIADASWADLAPLYQALADEPLTPSTVRAWLAAWSGVDSVVEEAYGVAMIAYTADTRDPKREAAYLRWAADIAPKLHEVHVRLGRRLLPLEEELPDLAVLLRETRTDVAIFREENLPRMAELEEMEAAYDKITGGLTVLWDGEEKTIPALQPFLLDRDRAVRERAFRLGAGAYLGRRDELASLFDRMVRVRHALAREAGFASYRDYAFAAKYRFDYTPDDCVRFHESVERVVLPAIRRLHEERRRRLGVDTLRPWDLQVHPTRATRLVPFQTTEEFLAGGQRIFDALDRQFGGQFRTMVEEQLLDLESRPGKAPGGYCTRLPFRGKPFIFMNAVGVHDDVSTLIHEAGHAFHAFATAHIPYLWQRSTGHEAAELASMTMELLAAPGLASPTGFYAPADAADAQIEHLEDLLLGLPHIACVDAFQHWVYTEGIDASPEQRDAMWLRIRARFDPDVDYTGLEAERVARWYRQSHIHTAPFYYIEYGIAQLAALQVWRQSLHDPERALGRYKAALALGGTRSLPEIYATAGATVVLDADEMAPLVAEVERRIGELRPVADAEAAATQSA